MQRARALRYVGLRALARCTIRSARGTCSKNRSSSQASRGPKNRGRSHPPPISMPSSRPAQLAALRPTVVKMLPCGPCCPSRIEIRVSVSLGRGAKAMPTRELRTQITQENILHYETAARFAKLLGQALAGKGESDWSRSFRPRQRRYGQCDDLRNRPPY